jgi:hypothetical protein
MLHLINCRFVMIGSFRNLRTKASLKTYGDHAELFRIYNPCRCQVSAREGR